MSINIDTSDVNAITKNKKFFSNVLLHTFFMILISSVSCCLNIFLLKKYLFVGIALIIFSVFSIIVLSITNNIFLIANKKEFVFFKTICVFFGFLLSMFVFLADISTVILAAALTTVLFFLMFIVSKTIDKKTTDFFGQLAARMFFIGFIFFLISIFLFLIGYSYHSKMLDSIFGFLFAFAFIFATIYDFKQISEVSNSFVSNEDNDFLVQYFAYRIYMDYTYFFYRILHYLIIKRRSNNYE
ncbi:MAG: Bax inhibitor-1 family protein [Bacilli bacterium]|nr:Bax inhibitor-1 family protein [Bacilli bacterium]